ncbi:MAG TPA: 5-formyltetrahydrofolate cyclo-ligase [Gracilimonas sp.]|uniref:5-formyltetrahydrofolate cyclo-ligase n=1 Tax=Gracilimonas sp. TaxID=1974203 RepID=UPI002D99025F|nr:5-formyltetrahydrofolate cyclo-ligase [Gracilimonas sp.]
MNSVQQQKQEIRDEVLSKRERISESEWRSKSEKIIGHLLNADFYKTAEVVHTYISMNKRGEVCTDLFIEQLFKDKKRVAVPITNFTDNTLSHSEIGPSTDLIENKWGVREPKNVKPIQVSELDLIIVPMAAADLKGNRLGYGKGFYDQFLKQTQALKAGLVFDQFLFKEIPVEEFDEKLDVIITEEDVIFS